MIVERIATGSFILSTGQLVSIVIGLAFSIVVARLLGPDNYGLLSISLTYPLLLASIADLGLGNVISSLTAQNNPLGKVYAWTGLITRTITSMVVGLATFILADFFASILARPEIASYIRTLSILTFSMSLLSAIVAVLNGLGKYKFSASVSILQYIVRGSVVVLLLILGLGLRGAVIGYAVSYAIIVLIYTIICIAMLGKPLFSRSIVVEMVSAALPLYAAHLGHMFLGPLVNTILSRHVSNYDLGNYNVALNSLAPINALVGSISIVLLTTLPLLRNNSKVLKERVEESIYYAAIISTSLSLLYLSILKPTIYLFYGKSYADAPLYALVYSMSIVLSIVFGMTIIGNYFIILKRTVWNALIGLAGTTTTLLSSYILIPVYKTMGAPLAYVLGSLASSILALLIATRIMGLNINYGKNLKALLAPLVSFIIAYTTASMIPRTTLSIITGMIAYIAVYLTLLPLVLDKGVIKRIFEIASRIELVGKIIMKLGSIYLKII